MASVIWSPRAIRRLGDIWFFIAERSEKYADSVSEGISQAALGLADFPEVGRIVPEFGRRDTREVLVGPYRLIYRFDGDTIVIMTVIHGARRISEADLAQ